jgi:AcrR family transcriptional regulator
VTTLGTDRPLRRDAAANRQRLLEAAAQVFAAHGLEASVEEIARVAGVGMGTLYRRFPNKDALVDAILRNVVELTRLVAEEALATQTHADALRWFIAKTIGASGIQHVFLSSQMWTGRTHDLLYKQVVPQMETMFNNARAAGSIRADAAFSDLVLLLRATRIVMDDTKPFAPEAWRRPHEILFDGLRPCPGREPLQSDPLDLDIIRRHSSSDCALGTDPGSDSGSGSGAG